MVSFKKKNVILVIFSAIFLSFMLCKSRSGAPMVIGLEWRCCIRSVECFYITSIMCPRLDFILQIDFR